MNIVGTCSDESARTQLLVLRSVLMGLNVVRRDDGFGTGGLWGRVFARDTEIRVLAGQTMMYGIVVAGGVRRAGVENDVADGGA